MLKLRSSLFSPYKIIITTSNEKIKSSPGFILYGGLTIICIKYLSNSSGSGREYFSICSINNLICMMIHIQRMNYIRIIVIFHAFTPFTPFTGFTFTFSCAFPHWIEVECMWSYLYMGWVYYTRIHRFAHTSLTGLVAALWFVVIHGLLLLFAP